MKAVLKKTWKYWKPVFRGKLYSAEDLQNLPATGAFGEGEGRGVFTVLTQKIKECGMV